MVVNKKNFEERLFLVHEVLKFKNSRNYISKKYNVPTATLQGWVNRYKTLGEDGLRPYKTQNTYPILTKIQAVEDVLYYKLTKQKTMEKYNISSSAVLNAWISNYNKRKEPKRTGRGLSDMKSNKKSSQISLQKRIEIVQYTLAKDKDYQAAIKKYGVSYQQIYTWIRKYNKLGNNGLTGIINRYEFSENLSAIEQLKLENKQLRARNEFLEMEKDFTKKLQELRRRDTPFH